MQATHIISHEGNRNDAKTNCNLADHTVFSEEVLGERSSIARHAFLKKEKFVTRFTVMAGEQGVLCGAWSLEVLGMLAVSMVLCIEFCGSCIVDSNFLFFCAHCYSRPFILGILGFLCVWFLNLFLFVLLVTKDFVFQLSALSDVFDEHDAKHIPREAITMFLYLSVALLAVWAVNIVLFINSGSCAGHGVSSLGENPERSPLMVSTVGFIVCVAPVLIFFGRTSTQV
eukprot:TRINITY_DN18872_c0_g1_i1.p1 TRINITY_DN18872_c0_g1~~TRINITY_DN18872_c0_g1_i1.p1  ORF type:complete len:237 (+),score=32.35 TRINITY_DN18872_c0_g1_i1:28-711(+)